MNRQSLVAGLFGVGLASIAAPAAAGTDCALRQITSLPADFTGGRVRVPVLIQDKPVDLLIATYSTFSWLSRRLVDQMGLPTHKSSKGIVTGEDQRNNIVVGHIQLKLGRAIAKDAYFGIVDILPQRIGNADGEIAVDYLSDFDLEIDPVGQGVNLFSKDHCPGKEVYWANSWAEITADRHHDRRLWLDVELDGRKVEASFSTASPVTVLQADAAEEHFGIAAAPGPREKTFATVKLGPLVIHNLRVTIEPYRGSLRSEFPELMIGMDVLGQFHSYFAFDEEKIFLTTVQADLAAGRKPNPEALAALRTPDPTPAIAPPTAMTSLAEVRAATVKRSWAGDLQGALAYADRAVELAPTDPQPLVDRARIRKQMGDLAGMRADIDRGLALPARDAEAHFSHGEAYELSGDLERALAEYKDGTPYFSSRRPVARVLRKLGRYDEALVILNEFASKYPKSPAVYNELCWTKALMGQLDSALEDCNHAIKLDQSFAYAWDSRGYVRLKAQSTAAAIHDYNIALDLKPDSASSLYGRGLAKRRSGDVAGADADQAAARAIDPDIDKNFGT